MLSPRTHLFLPCLLITAAASAQCGYTVTLATDKNYCVGSDLTVHSQHALRQITWYKDGQPVETVNDTQSLSDRPIVVNLLPVQTYGTGGTINDLGADNNGNIYAICTGMLLRWAPGDQQATTLIPFGQLPPDALTMFVDGQGNIYFIDAYSITADKNTPQITEYKLQPSGLLDSVTALSKEQANEYSYGIGEAAFVDCRGNIYVYTDNQNVEEWSPGASGVNLVASSSLNSPCSPYGGGGQVHVDAAGNIFFMVGSGVKKMAPGAAAAVTVVPGGCGAPQGSDFWMDANDTIYLAGVDPSQTTLTIEKWAPGAIEGQVIAGNIPYGRQLGGRIPITVDSKGNFYLGCGSTNELFEFPLTSTINSTYTPTNTGVYYAVVTDVQGYVAASDTIVINSPASGTPSIAITATAESTPVCTPITFTATATNPGPYPAYQWMVSGVPAGGDTTSYSYNLFANGDQVYCVMTAQDGCSGPVADTSNIITLSIDPQGAATVSIAAPRDSVCSGDSLDFAATVTNGSNNPTFQWLVNGNPVAGDISATYHTDTLTTGDVVTCLIASDDACGLAKSNSIPVVVSIPPVIAPGQIFTIPYGQQLTLDPAITGDVSTWLWTPATGLSDILIADPVADPAATTLYTLIVTAAGGCSDTATILVNVYTPLSVPSAFTPNGDGHNDIFYVQGGPVNSVVETFEVFDRWGHQVFGVHGVAPGDNTAGWDGRINGNFAPTGAYVYMVEMKFADGSRKLYKGTVMLIR